MTSRMKTPKNNKRTTRKLKKPKIARKSKMMAKRILKKMKKMKMVNLMRSHLTRMRCWPMRKKSSLKKPNHKKVTTRASKTKMLIKRTPMRWILSLMRSKVLIKKTMIRIWTKMAKMTLMMFNRNLIRPSWMTTKSKPRISNKKTKKKMRKSKSRPILSVKMRRNKNRKINLKISKTNKMMKIRLVRLMLAEQTYSSIWPSNSRNDRRKRTNRKISKNSRRKTPTKSKLRNLRWLTLTRIWKMRSKSRSPMTRSRIKIMMELQSSYLMRIRLRISKASSLLIRSKMKKIRRTRSKKKVQMASNLKTCPWTKKITARMKKTLINLMKRTSKRLRPNLKKPVY